MIADATDHPLCENRIVFASGGMATVRLKLLSVEVDLTTVAFGVQGTRRAKPPSPVEVSLVTRTNIPQFPWDVSDRIRVHLTIQPDYELLKYGSGVAVVLARDILGLSNSNFHVIHHYNQAQNRIGITLERVNLNCHKVQSIV